MTIENEFPEDVQALLQYLYTNTLAIPPSKILGISVEARIMERLFIYARIYALGDQFLIYGLKDQAEDMFVLLLDSTISFSRASSIAFTTVIRYIYCSTPASHRGLRGAVCQGIARYIRKNPRYPYRLFSQTNFVDIIDETETFAKDLVLALGKNP